MEPQGCERKANVWSNGTEAIGDIEHVAIGYKEIRGVVVATALCRRVKGGQHRFSASTQGGGYNNATKQIVYLTRK